ncbi:hypothetical protein HDU89_008010 [Geranomyces variabilis]|nr:hypothetical protein HDU89_008010 [Geranomyces variabilis]
MHSNDTLLDITENTTTSAAAAAAAAVESLSLSLSLLSPPPSSLASSSAPSSPSSPTSPSPQLSSSSSSSSFAFNSYGLLTPPTSAAKPEYDSLDWSEFFVDDEFALSSSTTTTTPAPITTSESKEEAALATVIFDDTDLPFFPPPAAAAASSSSPPASWADDDLDYKTLAQPKRLQSAAPLATAAAASAYGAVAIAVGGADGPWQFPLPLLGGPFNGRFVAGSRNYTDSYSMLTPPAQPIPNAAARQMSHNQGRAGSGGGQQQQQRPAYRESFFAALNSPTAEPTLPHPNTPSADDFDRSAENPYSASSLSSSPFYRFPEDGSALPAAVKSEFDPLAVKSEEDQQLQQQQQQHQVDPWAAPVAAVDGPTFMDPSSYGIPLPHHHTHQPAVRYPTGAAATYSTVPAGADFANSPSYFSLPFGPSDPLMMAGVHSATPSPMYADSFFPAIEQLQQPYATPCDTDVYSVSTPAATRRNVLPTYRPASATRPALPTPQQSFTAAAAAVAYDESTYGGSYHGIAGFPSPATQSDLPSDDEHDQHVNGGARSVSPPAPAAGASANGRRRLSSSGKSATGATTTTTTTNGRRPISSSSSSSRRAKSFACPVCANTFTRAYNLREHMQVHEEIRVRSHACHICTRSYYRNADLARHLKTRHNIARRGASASNAANSSPKRVSTNTTSTAADSATTAAAGPPLAPHSHSHNHHDSNYLEMPDYTTAPSSLEYHHHHSHKHSHHHYQPARYAAHPPSQRDEDYL